MTSPPLPLAAFGTIDWFVLGAYLALMLAIGLVAAYRESRHKSDTKEFFLGGRSMPTWALAISIIGSSLSVATFVGVPDSAFKGNLTYLMLYLGSVLAALFVAAVFVPRLYRAGTVTIYGYLAQRFGEPARVAVSLTFLFGRTLASAARVMLAAVPLCMLVNDVRADEVTLGQMILAIVAIGFVGTFYTVFGGIKTVVWVDTIQFVLVVGAALLTIGLLLDRIPASIGELPAILDKPGGAVDGGGKLRIVDLSTDPAKPFTLWAALTGAFLLNMAAFGVDHDLAQRFLVAKSPRAGAMSLIASQFVGFTVVSLFLVIGLLLHVFYMRPDVMKDMGPIVAHRLPSAEQAGAVYQWFLMKELPPIASGLAMAGLFAVAQGSMDSAINALASSAVADLYLPLKKMRRDRERHAARAVAVAPGGTLNYATPVTAGGPVVGPVAGAEGDADTERPSDAPKWAVAGMGAVMTLFGIACAYAYDPKEKGFLEFALGVMNFAFSGMLAVFLTALLTRRGNNVSVILALLTGVFVVALSQNTPYRWITGTLTGTPRTIAFTWAMPIATGLAFLVCVSGRRREAGAERATARN